MTAYTGARIGRRAGATVVDRSCKLLCLLTENFLNLPPDTPLINHMNKSFGSVINEHPAVVSRVSLEGAAEIATDSSSATGRGHT